MGGARAFRRGMKSNQKPTFFPFICKLLNGIKRSVVNKVFTEGTVKIHFGSPDIDKIWYFSGVLSVKNTPWLHCPSLL